MPNIHQFQTLKGEDLFLFSVLYHCRLKFFGLKAGGGAKQAI